MNRILQDEEIQETEQLERVLCEQIPGEILKNVSTHKMYFVVCMSKNLINIVNYVPVQVEVQGKSVKDEAYELRNHLQLALVRNWCTLLVNSRT